jgi:hypothetical protein
LTTVGSGGTGFTTSRHRHRLFATSTGSFGSDLNCPEREERQAERRVGCGGGSAGAPGCRCGGGWNDCPAATRPWAEPRLCPLVLASASCRRADERTSSFTTLARPTTITPRANHHASTTKKTM